MVDGIPEHTAGVDRVDVVHIAQHSPCAARQQRFGHRLIHAVRDAQELAGLGVDDGIAELARAVRIAEEIRRDAVKAVELDDAVSQQVKAVDDVFIQRGRFCQQDDGLGPGVLPERTVAVSIVGTVGAQDAQIVFVHPAQVRQGHPGVHRRAQAHAFPEALHIGIIRKAGAVHRIIEGIINGGTTDRLRQSVLPVLPGLRSLPDIVGQGHLGGAGSALSNVPRGAQAVVSGVKGHLVQLVGQSEQDAAQHAAAVGKADDPVLLVGADGVPAHQPLPGQLIQLRKGRGEPFFPGHLLVFVAAGQGRHSGVCLLHLGGIVGGEGRLCRILHLARSVCRPCGGSQHSRQHQCQCADRAQNSMALFLHVKTVPPRTPETGHLPPRYVSF